MSFVLDASVTVAWFFEDERTPAIDQLLARLAEQGAIVPTVWKLEVASAFQAAIRRGRIDRIFRDAALEHLSEFMIDVDAETPAHAWSVTLGLADRHGLTPYDAAYLELSVRRDLPLATLDTALQRAAAASGIEVLGMSP